MKLFMMGDFVGNTGPGIANKTIRKGLEDESFIMYSEGKNKLIRIIEIFFKTIFADCICICGFSKTNLFVIKLAKFFNKKVFYIMHGYSTYETEINNKSINENKIKKINNFEEKIFKNVDKVFCVSKLFMEFMKIREPKYSDKFSYIYSGVDIDYIEKKIPLCNKKKKNQIVSIGGGMPQKNNLEICKAINKLNKEKNLDLKFIVVGSNRINKNEIIKYSFVTYIDELSHDQILNLLSESYLYIQNSNFETFGLSIIEALLANCNLLISHNIGALEVINTTEDNDLIFNSTNIDEISCKIEKILQKENFKKLQSGLDIEKINYKKASRCLIEKIKRVEMKK